MQEHNDSELRDRLRQVIDQEIPHQLLPEQRLCLAILRQAYVDYFGADPLEKRTAAEYFAGSPLYYLTLRMFCKPEEWLPLGVRIELSPEGELIMNDKEEELTNLEALVRQLSGTQLKVVLTMGLMELPASAGRISKQCDLNRATVKGALKQLEMQALVESRINGRFVNWLLPSEVDEMLDEVWQG